MNNDILGVPRIILKAETFVFSCFDELKPLKTLSCNKAILEVAYRQNYY